MKLKITRTDGSVIEADGTPEECAALVRECAPVPLTVTLAPLPQPAFVQFPVFIPVPYVVQPLGPPIEYGPTWRAGEMQFSGSLPPMIGAGG